MPRGSLCPRTESCTHTDTHTLTHATAESKEEGGERRSDKGVTSAMEGVEGEDAFMGLATLFDSYCDGTLDFNINGTTVTVECNTESGCVIVCH